MEKYARIKKASEYFDISPSTIRRWIKTNKIRSYQFERIVIIKISDIENLFKQDQKNYENDNQSSVDDYVKEIMAELEN
ncbi:hypothetical protein MHK_005326 [Candidatus Magnetomorum sp. HK-1]|nr:hypothetical protein MHK_005326 [Candidatus Magnetomorum sp. HK-1]